MIIMENVSKTYIVQEKKGFLRIIKTPVVAIKDINFKLEVGDFAGLIGLNGAGKSTLVKMLTGILSLSSGQITVNGYNPFQERQNLVKTMGVLFGHRSQLLWDLEVEKTFIFHKYLYKLSQTTYQKRIDEIDQFLDIKSLFSKYARTLSLGQKMRANFALVFLHSPSVVFLDEPTIGLDIFTKNKVRQFLQYENEVGKTTILLTSHDMQDISELCKRVMILNEGTIQFNGDYNQLLTFIGGEKKVNIELVDMSCAKKLYAHMQSSEQISHLTYDKNIITISLSSKDTNFGNIVKMALAHCQPADILNVSQAKKSLEDLIVEFYQ